MADDIDIEEHDVLDNPKIRDIFPDLSLVKTEAPDEDVTYQDHYEEDQEYDQLTEYPINIKSEVLSDEENTVNYNYDESEQSTSYIYEQSSGAYEQSTEPYEQNTGAYEQSDVYDQNESGGLTYEYGQNIVSMSNFDHEKQTDSNDVQYSNKIILGSKPVIDYEVLYEEALNSTVSVFLENWDLKLKSSSCYCKACEILFPTVNALDAHNSVSHSFLVALDVPRPNTARKSTVNTTSTYCNHCDRTFPNDTALIKHLYELLPLNKFLKPTPQPVKVDARSVQFKCTKCVKYFSNYANGKRHKKLAHPTMANMNIIVRVVSNVDKPIPILNKDVKVKNEMIKKENEVIRRAETKTVCFSPSLVPKSVLFQCHICQINFLSCYSTIQHSNKCENKTSFQKCAICKKKIRMKDFQIHELQHKYTEKLKIYTLHRNMLEKVLLRCPKCTICYDERTFWMHRGTCNGDDSASVRCNICSINITQLKYEAHKITHISKKYTKKDFIIVEFIDTTKMPNTTGQVQRKPFIRTTDDTTVHYCECCGSYMRIYSVRGHTDGTCKNLTINYCEDCGLGFGKNTFKQHRLLHYKKKLSLNDFKIFSLSTRQQIDPPMPDFHKCEKCEKHFLLKEEMRHHNCETEPFQTCRMCNKKFNLKAIEPHSNFHRVKEIPLLLKKYNSINNIWNVIYECVACDLVSSSYDFAVEHCQYHINGYKRPPSKLCQICNLDILDKCYPIHMNLHKNNKMINRNKFTVLKYDFKHIFDAEWMSILGPLPKQHKYQILTKSIYRYSRRFKLNIEINCTTDNIKYFCKRCKTHIKADEMKQHYFNKSCKLSNKFVCSYCNNKHATLIECIQHENDHENVHKSYKIVTFNDPKDELFDQRLNNYESKVTSAKTPAKSPKVTDKVAIKKKSAKFVINKKKAIKMAPAGKISKLLIKSKKLKIKKTVKDETAIYNRIKLYKCKKCHCCISLRRNMMKHACTVNERKKRLCKICNEYFYTRHLLIHSELHKSLPKLPKQPLIIYFNPGMKAFPIATVFQCDCGLHFTSKQSIDNHLNVCSDGLEVSKEVCSKCNLLFPTDVLVSHLCKHHSKPVDIKIERVIKTEKGPYLCATCKAVYFTMSSFEEHLFRCPVRTSKLCQTCNHYFDQKTFGDHNCAINQEMTVLKSNAAVVKVYRCHTCNITYLFKSSYEYHMIVEHVNKREIVTCNLCKLRFTGQIIKKHMATHDPNENDIIKVIEPASEKSSIIKGRNFKIDCINKKTKRNDSALINKKTAKSTKKSTVNIDRKSPQKVMKKVIDQKISPKAIDHKSPEKIINQNMPIQVIDQKQPDATCTVYRCKTCDICFLYKKRIDYHLLVNHVMKRNIMACNVCGLRFGHHILLKHEPLHKYGDSYEIKIIDLGEPEPTILRGQNLKVEIIPPPIVTKSYKRRTRTYEDSALAKKAKTANDVDITDVKDSVNSDSFAQEPNTSKFDFESVNMTADNTTVANLNVTEVDSDKDPLNSSSDLPVFNQKSLVDYSNEISENLRVILDSTIDHYSNILFKCRKCNLHFLTGASLDCHLTRTRQHKKVPTAYKCTICGLGFSIRSLPRHVYIHHSKLNIGDESQFNILDDFTEDVSVIRQLKDRQKSEAKIKYFKCASCNVCFLDEASCRKHSINHLPLDPMTYIECKICNFQFLIDSLKKHMNVHHSSEFNLEDLVVTEYTATDEQPKIDIYRGIDKVQSRLVSTTTDMAVDSSEGV